mmetsp:Transcript_8173/g.24340  ORF Transcript_8173/g.24340 Transcript_8173/m.24340 type:complete len:208 (-) Transcript_8173:2476-3099(-)
MQDRLDHGHPVRAGRERHCGHEVLRGAAARARADGPSRVSALGKPDFAARARADAPSGVRAYKTANVRTVCRAAGLRTDYATESTAHGATDSESHWATDDAAPHLSADDCAADEESVGQPHQGARPHGDAYGDAYLPAHGLSDVLADLPAHAAPHAVPDDVSDAEADGLLRRRLHRVLRFELVEHFGQSELNVRVGQSQQTDPLHTA